MSATPDLDFITEMKLDEGKVRLSFEVPREEFPWFMEVMFRPEANDAIFDGFQASKENESDEVPVIERKMSIGGLQ